MANATNIIWIKYINDQSVTTTTTWPMWQCDAMDSMDNMDWMIVHFLTRSVCPGPGVLVIAHFICRQTAQLHRNEHLHISVDAVGSWQESHFIVGWLIICICIAYILNHTKPTKPSTQHYTHTGYSEWVSESQLCKLRQWQWQCSLLSLVNLTPNKTWDWIIVSESEL